MALETRESNFENQQWCLFHISLVIRQKDESQNGCFKKTKHTPNFPKNKHFLLPIFEKQAVRNARRIWHAFSWNTPFEICAFALLPTIWFIMILYYKMQEISLQYAAAILSQNTTKVYYKISQVFYYKMR